MVRKYLATLIIGLQCFQALSQASKKVRDSLFLELERATATMDSAEIYPKIGESYLFLYNDSAALFTQKGWEMANLLDNDDLYVKTSSVLGFAFILTGNTANSLEVTLKGLEVSSSTSDRADVSQLHANLMLLYMPLNKTELALYHADQAINTVSDTSIKAVYIGLKGAVYESIGELDSALFYYQESEKLSQSWSGLYYSLGRYYSNLENDDLALQYFEKCITQAKENLVFIDVINSLNGISELFERKNQLDSAIFFANLALNQEGTYSLPDAELIAHVQLADLYQKIGLKDSTIKYLKLSSELREELRQKQKIAEAQSILFNQQLQELENESQKSKYQSQRKINALIGGIFILIIAMLMINRISKIRKKARFDLEKAYNQLQSTQSQLIHSEKMASLGELTAGIAHEIQNPLNFVNNFSEVNSELVEELIGELGKGNIKEAEQIGKEIIENEDKITHHGKRAEQIVKSMLQHSRGSEGQKELTDMNALCDEYMRLAYHGFRAKDPSFNADFKLDLDPNLLKIEVIPQDIGRVLLNIINNAFQAVAEVDNPSVTLKTLVRRSSSEGGSKLTNSLTISIADNGPGIPVEIREKIFQPFFTTKPTGQGTGLGLSMSYDIVTKGHGGTIEAESVEEQGTTFIISLPYS